MGLELLHLGAAAGGIVNHRSLAFGELQLDAHGFQGEEDVGEDDGGIHTQFFYGEEGYLSCQLRRLTEGKKRILPPQGAVLCEEAACLPHQPDRRILRRFPRTGP